jgi:hypothetical protein
MYNLLLLTAVQVGDGWGGDDKGYLADKKSAVYIQDQPRLFMSTACNTVMRTHKIFPTEWTKCLVNYNNLSNIAYNYKSDSGTVDQI